MDWMEAAAETAEKQLGLSERPKGGTVESHISVLYDLLLASWLLDDSQLQAVHSVGLTRAHAPSYAATIEAPKTRTLESHGFLLLSHYLNQ